MGPLSNVAFNFRLRRYSVGVTTANVVRAPIQRSFALQENLVGRCRSTLSNPN
jgi:hypothetical protein